MGPTNQVWWHNTSYSKTNLYHLRNVQTGRPQVIAEQPVASDRSHPPVNPLDTAAADSVYSRMRSHAATHAANSPNLATQCKQTTGCE